MASELPQRGLLARLDPSVSERDQYVAARSVLLDALEALRPHLDAIVLVGAQAVYLRTETEQLGVAPYTTDGDVVLDPTRLGEAPELEVVMKSAGFDLDRNDDGSEAPGIWVEYREIDGNKVKVPVDLIVPTEAAPPGGRRGARLKGHSKMAARKIPGLEASLLDHDEMTVASLVGGDDRSFDVAVAGPVALLIAKAFKLHDRLNNQARPDRVDEKDAGDAYRIMRTADRQQCVAVARRVVDHPQLGATCATGFRYLLDLFRTRASQGTTMAISHFRAAVPEELVIEVCTGFVAHMRAELGAKLAPE